MENKLHLAGTISFIILIIMASCYFCSNNEEQKMTQKASIYFANQLKPEFQNSVNNYINAKGIPPASLKQLIYESNDPYMVEYKNQLNANDGKTVLEGNALKIQIEKSKCYMYFYLNGSEITTKVKC